MNTFYPILVILCSGIFSVMAQDEALFLPKVIELTNGTRISPGGTGDLKAI